MRSHTTTSALSTMNANAFAARHSRRYNYSKNCGIVNKKVKRNKRNKRGKRNKRNKHGKHGKRVFSFLPKNANKLAVYPYGKLYIIVNRLQAARLASFVICFPFRRRRQALRRAPYQVRFSLRVHRHRRRRRVHLPFLPCAQALRRFRLHRHRRRH